MNDYWKGRERDPFYNTARWQRLRRMYRRRHPLCEMCQLDGKVVPSQLVDHIIPISKGGSLTHMDNLSALCWKCHQIKTGWDQRKEGWPQRIDPATGKRVPWPFTGRLKE